MIAANTPPDEDFRLEVLRDYGVLDVQAEPALDELAVLAAQICDTPLAMISLVDADRRAGNSILRGCAAGEPGGRGAGRALRDRS